MTIKAVSTRQIEPINTGKIRKSHPTWFCVPPNKTTSGLAPAGGWMHYVNCISNIAIPTASAIVIVDAPKNFRKQSPTNADIKCPKITFLGCAKGELETANNKTQVAPKGAIINFRVVNCVNTSRIKIPNVPPIRERRRLSLSALGGNLSALSNKNFIFVIP